MNLHGVAGPVVAAVNPTLTIKFEASSGSTLNANFSRSPAFAAPVYVPGQMQELSAAELRQLEGLNLQGETIAIYLFGVASGNVRVSQKGGDRITVESGASEGVYLITKVLEQWPDWVKVAATLQNQAPTP